ncbi:hypothetical protein B0J13DRAFT_526102 [Dactylonectria estremocensis]|uniref:Uncharacterized protein n=1 Tax=Dactylonectria estremocensis TaxID=1079267 RepID=A0A9P9J1U0_9HYPO|nr:hypothetical protein B0J13DRAFT_526102 [Dactylonectria estremocensis]
MKSLDLTTIIYSELKVATATFYELQKRLSKLWDEGKIGKILITSLAFKKLEGHKRRAQSERNIRSHEGASSATTKSVVDFLYSRRWSIVWQGCRDINPFQYSRRNRI